MERGCALCRGAHQLNQLALIVLRELSTLVKVSVTSCRNCCCRLSAHSILLNSDQPPVFLARVMVLASNLVVVQVRIPGPAAVRVPNTPQHVAPAISKSRDRSYGSESEITMTIVFFPPPQMEDSNQQVSHSPLACCKEYLVTLHGLILPLCIMNTR